MREIPARRGPKQNPKHLSNQLAKPNSDELTLKQSTLDQNLWWTNWNAKQSVPRLGNQFPRRTESRQTESGRDQPNQFDEQSTTKYESRQFRGNYELWLIIGAHESTRHTKLWSTNWIASNQSRETNQISLLSNRPPNYERRTESRAIKHASTN